MILAKTIYKTHKSELLNIIKTFMSWCYYLKGDSYITKILMFTYKVMIFVQL